MNDRFLKGTGFFQRSRQNQMALGPAGFSRETFPQRNDRLERITRGEHRVSDSKLKIGITGDEPKRRLQFRERFRPALFPQRRPEVETSQWVVARYGKSAPEQCFAIGPKSDLPPRDRGAKKNHT